eukprot:364013-Chlamydomonas_euryale.AAC.12
MLVVLKLADTLSSGVSHRVSHRVSLIGCLSSGVSHRVSLGETPEPEEPFVRAIDWLLGS